ncbi:MAG TPA: isocitrate/isopropylmalate family dehydrogenase, partial [Burkholderiaceae bacterium]|nr:isocitrate/isopropylmalate family dehydrogenase [Burkholderiaceae bacterium]
GSAPDIAGRGIANPVAMIWSGALMVDFLGGAPGLAAETAQRCRAAHDAIVAAIEQVLRSGPRTRDIGGTADTEAMGHAIEHLVAAS